jgi:hypothetical protein
MPKRPSGASRGLRPRLRGLDSSSTPLPATFRTKKWRTRRQWMCATSCYRRASHRPLQRFFFSATAMARAERLRHYDRKMALSALRMATGVDEPVSRSPVAVRLSICVLTYPATKHRRVRFRPRSKVHAVELDAKKQPTLQAELHAGC